MIEQILYEVVDGFVPKGSEMPSKYNERGDYLVDAIEEVFSGYKDQYSIVDVGTFESPGYDCGIISVAFIEDGQLHHMNFEWEMA